MKRAAELSVIDEWNSDSGLVEKAWTSHSESEPPFISIAVSRWQIVVTTERDVTQLTVRGPETRPRSPRYQQMPSSSASCSASRRSCPPSRPPPGRVDVGHVPEVPVEGARDSEQGKSGLGA